MTDIDPAEYVRMRNEYHVTLRVLALVVEQLLTQTKSEILELTDEAVLNAPDLTAMRDSDKGIIGLRVER